MLIMNKAAGAVRPSVRQPVSSSCRVVRPFTAASSSSKRMVKVNFFNFGKKNAQDTSAFLTSGRSDFDADDVEHYFNYMGMLATEGTYDRLEAMMASGLEPVDLLLLMAASENDTPKIEELLSAGADVSVKDVNGKTAMDLATKPEILAMLKAKQTASA
jgi:hypothetical protein